MANVRPNSSHSRWQRRAWILAGALLLPTLGGACGSSQNELFTSSAGGTSSDCDAAQCPDAKLCPEGECGRVCEPLTKACAGGSVVTCSADGTGFGEPQPCPVACVSTTEGARCANGEDGSVGSGGGGAGGSGGSGGSAGNSGGSGAGGSAGVSGGGGAPNTVILIDRSTSAEALLPDGVRTRWSMIQNDVISAVRSAEQRSLRVALGVYGYTGFAPPFGNECPAIDGLMPANNNFAQVAERVAALAMPDGKSETPTGAAISQVTALLAGRSDRKSVILITDGVPDTCDKPDQPCWDQTVFALQASFRAGVTTRIIGIGPDVSQELLQDLANAGAGVAVQTPPPGRVVCGPGVPTYAPNGGAARYEHLTDSGLDQALLAAITAAAAP